MREAVGGDASGGAVNNIVGRQKVGHDLRGDEACDAGDGDRALGHGDKEVKDDG